MSIFCQCQYFVNANILSTSVFYRSQYFVNANILLTPIFCRRQYFFGANFMLTPISEPRPTLSEPCPTLSEPGRTLSEPCRTLSQPRPTLSELLVHARGNIHNAGGRAQQDKWSQCFVSIFYLKVDLNFQKIFHKSLKGV
jgi:hypothetical protein